MNAETIKKSEKAYAELKKLIYKNEPNVSDKDLLLGTYLFWAKIDALENALIKKNIISKEDILLETIPVLNAMKKDFTKTKLKKLNE